MTTDDHFKGRTIIAHILEIVGEFNNYLISRIPEDEKIYLSTDSACIKDGGLESQLHAFSRN